MNKKAKFLVATAIFSAVFLLFSFFWASSVKKVNAAGAPIINSVSTSHSDGNFKAGENVNFDVTYSEAVNVAGSVPVIALNSGGAAVYESGSGSTNLVFKYIVGSSDNSARLTYSATSSLTTSGTIKNLADDTDAINDLPDPTIFSGTHNIIIDTVSPSVTKLGDGLSDFTIADGSSADLIFDAPLATSSKTAIENMLTNGANQAITYSWNATSSILTIIGNLTNVTTFNNDVKVSGIRDLAGNISGELLLIDSKLEANQSEPAGGVVNVNNTTNQAVLTSASEPVNVIVDLMTATPSIDVSSFVNNGLGIMPNITISIPMFATVNIATNTTITAASSSWVGILSAPTQTSVTLPETDGQTKTLSTAFEVGSTQTKLTFDKAVRIFVLGQGGKRVGYVDDGGAFVEVSNICTDDSQSWTDTNLSSGGDCKKDLGDDLVIWTKHFTKFAIYDQAPVGSCAPSSVANGNVTAYPACVISCDSGYTLNGTSCIARSTGGGGGIAAPIIPQEITAISSLSLPMKLSLLPTQTGSLTEILSNSNQIKLSFSIGSVATKTDISISSFAIGSLKPTKNLQEVLLDNNIFEIDALNSNGLINNSLLKPANFLINITDLSTDLSGLGVYLYNSDSKLWSLISNANFDATKKIVSFSSNQLGEFAIFRSSDKTIPQSYSLESAENLSIMPISISVNPVSANYVSTVISQEIKNAKNVDRVLVKKLAGKIILQVATLGRAWYVDPVSLTRYYLADGQTSFDALRKFGLGIKNSDLAKIPVGIDNSSNAIDSDSDGLSDKLEQAIGTNPNKADSDGDGFPDKLEIMNGYNPLGAGKIVQSKSLIQKLKGRIVIQVEGAGQAWYINPSDGKRYYLADGNAAYNIMRQLSLGISNELINKIPVAK